MPSASLMDSLFQRTLEDLIKGIRLQLIGESAFISKAVEEIRREIKTTDLSTKSIALQKLTYLHELHGVDMSWAAFHAVEVVSSSKFAHKKIGYHAISLSFNDHTTVLLLITNQLRKDLNSTNEFEVSLALECLSRIGTEDLARDLTPEVFKLLGSNKVLVKKKAIGVALRVFEKNPDAVRVCFKRLVENLDNSDPQILCAAIGVFCELTVRDPGSYLPLAPEFYKILLDSRNNWILIKVLKIFAKLAPLEPRLAKKIVEPVCEHMRRTGAKSLLFECIRTIVSSLAEYEAPVKLAVEKIREFLVDKDPNLKYLGLHALSIIALKHLWAILENKEFVIKALSDEDPNVKLEALRLVMVMVSESNVAEIARVLVNYALKSDPDFCNEIIGSILSTCSKNLYKIIIDFDWYVSLLGEIARIPHCQKGEEIEHQLFDIGMRVKDVRPELARVARSLLIDPALLGNPFVHRILCAAAWVSGEYVEFSRNPFEIVEALLQPRTCLLPPSIRAVYIQAAFKALVFCMHCHILVRENGASSAAHGNLEPEAVSERGLFEHSGLAYSEHGGMHNSRILDFSSEGLPAESSGLLENHSFTTKSIENLINLIEFSLAPLSGSHDVEIQERARNVLGFINYIKKEILNQGAKQVGETEASKAIEIIHDAFSELGPVSTTAQERVPVPDGLDLKEGLGDLQEICGDILQVSVSSNSFSFVHPVHSEETTRSVPAIQVKEEPGVSHDSASLLEEHRKKHGLYYLTSEKSQPVSDDYPPANELKSSDSLNDDATDLSKLAEHTFMPKRKPNHMKPRPVVVKLDDGNELRVAPTKPLTKDDSLSGAIRNILLGSESGTKGKEKQDLDLYAESMETMPNTDKPSNGGSTSRRKKHHNHGKERRQRSPKKKNPNEEVEENGEKEKQKKSHRRSKHKARQRADEPLNVPAQLPVIPDFLL